MDVIDRSATVRERGLSAAPDRSRFERKTAGGLCERIALRFGREPQRGRGRWVGGGRDVGRRGRSAPADGPPGSRGGSVRRDVDHADDVGGVRTGPVRLPGCRRLRASTLAAEPDCPEMANP